MTAITAFRSLTMTEILSVPVPMQPAVAVERPVTHHSLGIRSDRNDEQVDTRHLGWRNLDARVVRLFMFIGRVSPKR